MKRPVLKGGLLGLAAYLIFLIAALPATYVSSWVGKHLPSVRLSDVSGSVFSGRAAAVRIGQSDLGAVDWSFDWLAPFTLTVGYRFHLHDDARDLAGRLDAGFGSLHLRDLRGHVPVASLDAWSPLPTHSLSGNLVLDLKQVQLKAGRLQSATGDVELDDGSMSWPTPYTLGSYRMSLVPVAAGGITGEISDVASPLKLHADLSLGADGRYRLKGILAARDPGDAGTRNFLSGLGRPDSTGQYPFDFNGQW
jgi:general secretion pathway protein N